MNATRRDVLSPKEVAERAGFSYHAILRAIRRGDLHALEPVPGRYRIELTEYERWLHRPAPRPEPNMRREPSRLPPRRRAVDPAHSGSLGRLRAIENG
jgi:excisionase family DNA binding protein